MAKTTKETKVKMTKEEKKKLGIRIGAGIMCAAILVGCVYTAVYYIIQGLA